MLITESQMGYGYGGTNALRLLDNMHYLSEEESRFSPAMVPIVENAQVGANLIRLEDLLAFGESNGINDLGYALQLVCESSNVSPNTIALTVQEEAFYLSDELQEASKLFLEEGFNMFSIGTELDKEEKVMVETALKYFIEAEENDDEKFKSNAMMLHGQFIDSQEGNEKVRKEMDSEIRRQSENLKNLVKDSISQEDFESNKKNIGDSFRIVGDTNIGVRKQQFGISKEKLNLGDFSKVSNQFYDAYDDETARKAQNKFKKIGGIGGKIFSWLIKSGRSAAYNDSRAIGDDYRDIVEHINKEQIPRSFLSRMIAKLRNVYKTLMLRLHSGIANKLDQSQHDKWNMEQMKNAVDDNGKIKKTTALKVGLRNAWWAIKAGIKKFAGKVLFLIDKLLQKLQNTSDSASDKIHGWLGMKKNEHKFFNPDENKNS